MLSKRKNDKSKPQKKNQKKKEKKSLTGELTKITTSPSQPLPSSPVTTPPSCAEISTQTPSPTTSNVQRVNQSVPLCHCRESAGHRPSLLATQQGSNNNQPTQQNLTKPNQPNQVNQHSNHHPPNPPPPFFSFLLPSLFLSFPPFSLLPPTTGPLLSSRATAVQPTSPLTEPSTQPPQRQHLPTQASKSPTRPTT